MTSTTPPPSKPVELVVGRVYALGHPIPLDGRVSWAPELPGRYQSFNCYLLKEADQALLVDTGLRAHWPLIAQQLTQLLVPGSPLKLFMTRPEPDAVSNLSLVRQMYDMHDTDVLAGGHDTPFDFFETAASRREGPMQTGPAPGIIRTDGFDLSPTRRMAIIVPKLRFLPTFWPFDVATRTLFTSDLFAHVDQPEQTGTRIVDSLVDLCTEDELANQLFAKFWWLPGATTVEFANDLRSVFERLRPEIVAPGYGAILVGRDVIEAHLELLLRVLEGCASGRFGIPSTLRSGRA